MLQHLTLKEKRSVTEPVGDAKCRLEINKIVGAMTEVSLVFEGKATGQV